MSATKRSISAIVACYKDAEAIPHMAKRLESTLTSLGAFHEIIFVNDGSPDDSQAVLEALAAANPKIKVITHSRNFGSQNAFTSGLQRATGDACVLLDGDLQDPPEIIAELHKKWLEGYDVVYGVRVRRDMPRQWELAYKSFYRIFRVLSYVQVPVDAGDFSLLDRRVVNALLQLPERDRFLRGLRAWVGFRQIGVDYVRPERMFGRSTNNLWANVRWARKGIFAFSYLPLELISLIALFTAALSALAIVVHVIDRIIRPDLPHGISTIIVLCLFLGAVQLTCIAFIGEYVAKIFEEVKRRPHFVVARTINLDAENKTEAASR